MTKTPAGMVRLWHDGGGCSVGGREYPADADGFVTVPHEVAPHLVAAHGFCEDKPEGEPADRIAELEARAAAAELRVAELEAAQAAKDNAKGAKA